MMTKTSKNNDDNHSNGTASRFAPTPLGPDNPFSYDQMAASEEFLYAMENQRDTLSSSSSSDKQQQRSRKFNHDSAVTAALVEDCSNESISGGVASRSANRLANQKKSKSLQGNKRSMIDGGGGRNVHLSDHAVALYEDLAGMPDKGVIDESTFSKFSSLSDDNTNPVLVHKGMMV